MKTKVKLTVVLLPLLMVVVLFPAVAQAETFEVDDAVSFAEALALLILPLKNFSARQRNLHNESTPLSPWWRI